MKVFIETNCEFHGIRFNGAYLTPHNDGSIRGLVYLNSRASVVTDWHGNILARAIFSKPYDGPNCKMQSVSFIKDGIRFIGRGAVNARAVNVRGWAKPSHL